MITIDRPSARAAISDCSKSTSTDFSRNLFCGRWRRISAAIAEFVDVTLEWNWAEIHHSIHKFLELEFFAAGRTRRVVGLAHLSIAEIIAGDLRRARDRARPHI